MRIQEAIAAVTPLMPSEAQRALFVRWLSNVDLTAKNEIFDTHEGSEEYAGFTGYDPSTDPETALLVPAPYDQIYPLWLEAQVHYMQGEYGRYNNALATFQAAWRDFASYYNRTHAPKGEKIKYTAGTGEDRFDPLG